MKIKNVLKNRAGRASDVLGKNVLGVPLALIVVVALAALILGGKVDVEKFRDDLHLFAISGGVANTLSLSKVDFVSNSQFLSGPQWVLSMIVGNQGNDIATGRIPVGGLKAGLDQNSKAFNLSLSMNSQSCNYPIFADGERIYTMNYQKETFRIPVLDLDKKCQELGQKYVNEKTAVYYASSVIGSLPLPTYVCNYNVLTPKAVHGDIGTPSVEYDLTATFTRSDGVTKIANLGSKTAGHAPIGDASDNIGFVDVQGSLVSPAKCPEAVGKDITSVYVETNKNWITVSDSAYKNYQNYAGNIQSVPLNSIKKFSGFGGIFDSCLRTAGSVSSCVDTWNGRVNTAVTSIPFDVKIGGRAVKSVGTASSGSIIVDLNRAIEFPLITAYLKASWVGIIRNTAQPEIVSTNSACFSSGKDGNLIAQIKNKGSVGGSITVSATCASPIEVQPGGSFTEFVNAGDTRSFAFPLKGITSQDELTKDCKITAVGADPTLVAIATQSACVKKLVVACQSGEIGTRFCSGDLVMQCTSDGEKVTDDCGKSSQTCDVSTKTCIDKEDGKAGWWDKLVASIRDFFAGLGLNLGANASKVIAILIGVALLIVAIMFGKTIPGILSLIGFFFTLISTGSIAIALIVAIVIFFVIDRLGGSFDIRAGGFGRSATAKKDYELERLLKKILKERDQRGGA